ncbi:NAD(P)/FAD-dependent oxidoreductase [Parafrigoribacterium humi]|jgi:3-phenylpropionate/trans-cinnamate dioxygenase ferredoxin reductase subunit|uniref:NAD(P)/FAD-dependent oxidoreductase n=1 Tax=Parafrigoribacterium humi TaxID=3144664 RepID=UPI0032EEC73D
MSTEQNFVIVGGGLAGASAAEELRKQGFDGSVTLLASEKHEPYIRPPLSKGYLNGSDGLDAVYVHPSEWYAENHIDVKTGTSATSIDRAAHEVTLSTGEKLPYDKLLLATGSSPRQLPIEGADLAGVHYLRTLDDSEALQAELKAGGKKLVLVGSGWIGMEVGATARTLGNEVTILERDPIPLANALGDELGTLFADYHKEKGVVLRTSLIVDKIVGADGHVNGVALDGGEIVPADLVLVGIGAVPNVQLAKDAGLDVDNGILTDASLKTSDPDIYAAGDVASALHPLIGQRLRSEHWANALNEGPAAARAMLGQEVAFDDIPYFYTDQFDLGMEYSGYGPLTRDAKVVYRGNKDSREFIAFWVADGKVVAGMNVNVWDVNEQVQRIIREGAKIDEARLADESVPLEEL